MSNLMDCKLSVTLFKFIENNDTDCFVTFTNRRWECVSDFSLNLGFLSEKKCHNDMKGLKGAFTTSNKVKSPSSSSPPTFSLSLHK